MPGDSSARRSWPSLVVALFAAAFGSLILRRRGVYFSLLTLALSAMMYVVAFRWTEVTGGENGLGGITQARLRRRRPRSLGPPTTGSSPRSPSRCWCCLWRFHHSPVGTVLVAIRENEQRARFLGYPTNRYKLVAFVLSATLTGLAGVLLLYNNRMTSADPISVAFSGELLAMVVIGGMRSFLGPALGALFYILFREFLSIYTENWLLWFGLVFVGFIVFSPTGLVGVGRAPARAVPQDGRRGRRDVGTSRRRLPLPAFLRPKPRPTGVVLEARSISKRFGGIKAVQGVTSRIARPHPARPDRPQRRRQDHGLQPAVRHVPRRTQGDVRLLGRPIAGRSPEQIASAGIGRSFQITNLFPALTVEENIRLAVQARHPRASILDATRCPSPRSTRRDRRDDALPRPRRHRSAPRPERLSYGGQRLLDMGLALATAPRVLLLDEPLAGLAAAERERIGAIIKRISADIPVLLVEHDIDRVFQLADHVTVMNDGRVLLDGTVEEARSSPRCRRSISARARRRRRQAARDRRRAKALLTLEGVNTFYGKSHILNDVCSPCTSTRSSRCSGATAPASRRC